MCHFATLYSGWDSDFWLCAGFKVPPGSFDSQVRSQLQVVLACVIDPSPLMGLLVVSTQAVTFLQVLDCIKPGQDEIIISKTSCSVFRATNINRVLQNLGIRHLIMAGCLTDQCVESAVRDACDSNYFVTLVTGLQSNMQCKVSLHEYCLWTRS